MEPIKEKEVLEIVGLESARFPSMFVLTGLQDANSKPIKFLVPTTQTSGLDTLFTGEKPDNIDNFFHTVLCLTTVGRFYDALTKDERQKILSNVNEPVDVGIIELTQLLGTMVIDIGKYNLIINGKNQKVFVKKLASSI